MTAAASKGLNLTIEDLAAIAALVVAVVSALLAPIWFSLRRAHAATKQTLNDARKAEVVPSLALRSQANALQAISIAFESTIGLLHRLLVDRASEIDGAAAISHLHEVKTAVDRAAAEARLFTDVENQQISALQQLVHRIGDLQTLHLLEEAAACAEIGWLSADDYRRAAQTLSERLAQTG